VALLCPVAFAKGFAVGHLVDLLLFVNTELPGTAVNKQEKTADNGQDLEEVVFGEVLVRVMLVELV
jgi:uncharacterized membrane protein YciS (DUF1049 family)